MTHLTIPLTNGREAIISASDFDLVSQFKWNAHCGTSGSYYAQGYNKKSLGGDGRLITMHRLIMGFPNSGIDHKNGNGLDNRRENLRLATQSQNAFNINRSSRGTIFQGIYWFKRIGLWTGQVTDPSRKRISIGYFKDDFEAAFARDCLARSFHGEYARLNFPVEMIDAARSHQRPAHPKPLEAAE